MPPEVNPIATLLFDDERRANTAPASHRQMDTAADVYKRQGRISIIDDVGRSDRDSFCSVCIVEYGNAEAFFF